jgi:hypothetical protein
LSGTGDWELSCPACACQPSALLVCREDHVACVACGRTCSVCGDQFCKEHGIAECHVDRAPSCSEHSRTCSSCHRLHCSAHEGQCAEGDHAACVSCLAPCVLCARTVCASHARQSTPGSPRGVRRFCPQCVVYCEGGKNEPVGRDEVVRCASCERSVCEVHQAKCAVDGRVHCSTHLRRTDRSRRLVCQADRAICTQEPEAIFAADEVAECATCPATVCTVHTGVCIEDGTRYCMHHLAPLKDRAGALGCAAHRTTCHIDSLAFSVKGTVACPVCARRACNAHLYSCSSCARSVCTQEFDRSSARCSTCMHLVRIAEPGDDLIAAAMDANGGEMPSAKEWRAFRDATHTVVELPRGWMRRTVFTVRHGDQHAQTVVTHSPLGSRRRR